MVSRVKKARQWGHLAESGGSAEFGGRLCTVSRSTRCRQERQKRVSHPAAPHPTGSSIYSKQIAHSNFFISSAVAVVAAAATAAAAAAAAAALAVVLVCSSLIWFGTSCGSNGGNANT